MKRSLVTRGLALLAFVCAMPLAMAQTPTPSFSLLGHLEELDVDDLGNALSAGWLTVNGVKVRMPANLLITMPGQYLTLNDLFRGPHPGSGAAIKPAVRPSGLALKDSPRPPVTFEAEVIGNIVGGQYVAGVVKLSQQGLNGGAGVVQSIDYAKGELLVGALGGVGTARVRMNDAGGIYGKKNADKVAGADPMDERFGADPGNAPIHAETGFPMCIPRVAPPANDADCPTGNRMPGREGRFTCGATTVDPTAPAHPGCNAARMAPIIVGDYVAYSGMLTEDAPGSGTFFIAAHAIGVLAGIYTAPGADPAYVLIEEAIVGTLGEPFPNVDQEETSRFRIVGFTTDPTRQVDVFVVDIDAAGNESERLLTRLAPSRAAQIGRIRITLDAKSNFLPVTRDVRIRIDGHTSVKVAGGLDSGQYTAPVGEYIYPENTRFGTPRVPVSVPFENFCFLKNGGGQLTTLGRTAGPAIGRLNPFPDSGHPTSMPRADGTPACP